MSARNRQATVTKPPGPGRPPGAENVRTETDALLSRCPSCGGTERTKYVGNKLEQEISGTAPDGQPFTHIVRRRTQCTCGQFRIERTYENRPEKR